MYYSHNLHFLAIAYSMEGRFADSVRAARQLESNVGPHVKEMPMLEGFNTVVPLLLVRFRRWDDALARPEPPAALAATHTIWVWSRGSALAATGKTEEAEAAYKSFVAAERATPADASFGLNKVSDVLRIADDVLAARIAAARGDRTHAIELLKAAVAAEDALSYDEPPAWFLPTRETLGGVLLSQGKAAEAETVFREDLKRNPRSGRSLFGLWKSLEAQHKAREADASRRDFEAAWKNADTQLKVEDL